MGPARFPLSATDGELDFNAKRYHYRQQEYEMAYHLLTSEC